MILYSHRVDADNPGDKYSSPRHYFDMGSYNTVDIAKPKNTIAEQVPVDNYSLNIVGGGDIFASVKWTKWNLDIAEQAQAKHSIIWGAGILFRKQDIVDLLDRYSLIGTRVYQESYSRNITFVPCASCMHELFDQEYEITKEVGLIRHFKREIPYIPGPTKFGLDEHSKIRNKPQTMEDVITFIGSHETIITNSYHAAYWAQLLNRRVICYVPNDNPDDKLLTFENNPIVYGDNEFSLDLVKQEYNYENLLVRYRERNQVFHERVVNEYLSSNMS